MARKYELNKRALKQEETRRRIVEATVALHEEIGPARTTISAIAERAGVERLTVYRHFPDEREIFLACSTRFAELHPRPDPASWLAIADPAERLRTALHDVYRYFVSAEPMLAKVLRDAPDVPAIAEAVDRYQERLKTMVNVLVAGWRCDEPDARKLEAAIRMGLALSTWQALTRESGLTSDEAADLVAGMIAHLAESELRLLEDPSVALAHGGVS